MTTTSINWDVDFNEEGKIISFLNGKLLADKPEERVRQRFAKILHYEYGYSKDQMDIEVPIYYGANELTDENGNPVRADIVVYESKTARENRDQGKILLIVECKAPNVTGGYNQLVSYIYNTSAGGGVWFNGEEVAYFRRLTHPHNTLVEWPGIPRKNESWDAIGRRKKSELLRPKDIKGLFKRCHNKLHSRGSEEDDLTMDMVRIILAKAMDEEKEGEYPQFYCTPEEYSTEEGRRQVEERIQALFDEVKELNRQVFDPHEKISVGSRALCDVVCILQDYQLLADFNESHNWDLMGHAYEEYTEVYLKRRKGQFFTNRLVVDFLVKLIDPTPSDIVLDPAGGSGGFLTGVMRYVRNKIVNGSGSSISKQRQLDRFRSRLFMVESSKRLVKVAKTAMILNGDGHAGMTQGDSLADYNDINETIHAQCGRGVPTVILTNPPFAGIGEGRITDKPTLERFQLSRKWEMIDGKWSPTEELLPEGVPPEMLFLERCIDWLAPGGKLGIVLPKGFLDTNTYLPARAYLLKHCKLLAVVNLHKNTFQPFTGVRTCLVIAEKYKVDETTQEVLREDNYDIFMAISRKIGQDSEGKPIYKTDDAGNVSEELDHDLDDILSNYKAFVAGNLKPSNYCYSVSIRDIDETLNINPQRYMPNLNETIKLVTQIGEIPGWSVEALGQIHPDIRIYKGPRLRSENLVVEEMVDGANVEPYYTPSAILQDKSDSMKYLDLSKATTAQLRTIEKIRVRRHFLVITRSGTIGRIAYITKQHDNAIVSDDLIRIEIPDEDLRHYVYVFLQSQLAQDQFKRNEYGSIQQHLEPAHVREVLIPIPDDIEVVRDIIDKSKKALEAKEAAQDLHKGAMNALEPLLQRLREASSDGDG
ncbi:MAG: N-6 DNA methylase [Firmicutes bacterium]|nr:N-6 DNA methylase [Bacillota bacterium]